MPDVESNRQAVRAYVAAFNAGDFGALRALFTPDDIVHGVLGWGPLDEVMPIWRELHDGLSASRVERALQWLSRLCALQDIHPFWDGGHQAKRSAGLSRSTGRSTERASSAAGLL
ncbi:nuclear transport factor 2 family protein [Azospirillum sp. sgz302134]